VIDIEDFDKVIKYQNKKVKNTPFMFNLNLYIHNNDKFLTEEEIKQKLESIKEVTLEKNVLNNFKKSLF
jgi:endonuclease IV